MGDLFSECISLIIVPDISSFRTYAIDQCINALNFPNKSFIIKTIKKYGNLFG